MPRAARSRTEVGRGGLLFENSFRGCLRSGRPELEGRAVAARNRVVSLLRPSPILSWMLSQTTAYQEPSDGRQEINVGLQVHLC